MAAQFRLTAAALVTATLVTACSNGGDAPADGTSSSSATGPATSLTLGAYTTPREAYSELLPMFAATWKERSGADITFEESYLGSGAQSRAIVEGFEADVAALSLEADIDRIEDAGLITTDWTATPTDGMVSRSLVAFAVRPGNPKNIADWADLAQPALEILTPNPKTSGGAMWNVLALYGAALRGKVDGVPANDEAAATQFLRSVVANISVMDKGARESITNFEQGVGDVAITYENEVLTGQAAGQAYQLVLPSSTILIENPIAIVDAYAAEHGNLEAAQALVDFLLTDEAQQVFARHGFRSVSPAVTKANAAKYPEVADMFTIQDLGGWDAAIPHYFGDDGIFTQAVADVMGANP